MARDGTKTGGRKKGVRNKRTLDLLAKAAVTKITPLEVMLQTMQYLWDDAHVKDPETGKVTVDRVKAVEAADMAKSAAPYVHPRLNAIEGGDPNKPLNVNVNAMPDDEAARTILFALRLGAVAAGKKRKA